VNEYVANLWHRASQALDTARRVSAYDPDAAASRAYYAAFHAVSALFALEGREFKKHSALEAAVHRDLVKAGRWPQELGTDYHFLYRLRTIGDYGGAEHVSGDDAQQAIGKAERLLEAVRQACPELK